MCRQFRPWKKKCKSYRRSSQLNGANLHSFPCSDEMAAVTFLSNLISLLFLEMYESTSENWKDAILTSGLSNTDSSWEREIKTDWLCNSLSLLGFYMITWIKLIVWFFLSNFNACSESEQSVEDLVEDTVRAGVIPLLFVANSQVRVIVTGG